MSERRQLDDDHDGEPRLAVVISLDEVRARAKRRHPSAMTPPTGGDAA